MRRETTDKPVDIRDWVAERTRAHRGRGVKLGRDTRGPTCTHRPRKVRTMPGRIFKRERKSH